MRVYFTTLSEYKIYLSISSCFLYFLLLFFFIFFFFFFFKIYNIICLRELKTFSGEATLIKNVQPFFWKGVYSKRKEFAAKGSKFFPFSIDPILEVTWCAVKQIVNYKSCLPCKIWGKCIKCIRSPKNKIGGFFPACIVSDWIWKWLYLLATEMCLK